MKRRSIRILGLAVALVAVLSVHALREPIEELWLLHRLEFGGADAREHAATRLAERRSVRAVRPLVALLLAEPPAEADRSHPFRPSPPAVSVWERALTAIGSRAMPQLMSEFRERTESERNRVGELIERIELEPREATAALEGLADPELETLHGALADGLVKLGPSLRGVERRVLVLVGSETAETRRRAVALLRSMRGAAGSDEGLARLLVKLLDDPDEGVRAEAAYTIGHFRERGAGTLDALERLAGGPADEASAAANWTIKRLKGD